LVFPAKQQRHLETHDDYLLLNPHLRTMHEYHPTAFYTHISWQHISIKGHSNSNFIELTGGVVVVLYNFKSWIDNPAAI
jgi:hypothetical protein